MTDTGERPAAGRELDLAAAVAGLQDQVDALTATLEGHQRLFERLHQRGLLDPDRGERS